MFFQARSHIAQAHPHLKTLNPPASASWVLLDGSEWVGSAGTSLSYPPPPRPVVGKHRDGQLHHFPQHAHGSKTVSGTYVQGAPGGTVGLLAGSSAGPPQGPLLKLWVEKNGAPSAAVSQVPEAATVRCFDMTENGRIIVTGSGDCASVYHIKY